MNDKTMSLYGESQNELRGKRLPEVEVPAGSLAGLLSGFVRDKMDGFRYAARSKFDQYRNRATNLVTAPIEAAGRLAGNYSHGNGYNAVKSDVRAALHGDYRGMTRHDVPYGSLQLDGERVDSMHKGRDFYIPKSGDTGLSLYRTAHEVAESEYMQRRGITRLNKFEHAMYESMVLRSLRELGSYGDSRAREAYRAAEGTHNLRLVRGDSNGFTRLTMRHDPVLSGRLAA